MTGQRTTLDLHLNHKAVFHDDGNSIMAVNPWAYPPARVLIENRERFHALFERLRPSLDRPIEVRLDDDEREILSVLERIGLLLPTPIPDEAEARKLSRGAVLGTFVLEIEAGQGSDGALSEARLLVRTLGRRLGGLQRVVCRFVGEEPLGNLTAISALMKAIGEEFPALGLPTASLSCEIVSPLAHAPDDLERMLDSNAHVRLVVEDREEAAPASVASEEAASRCELTRRLSHLGFSVQARIPTAFPATLAARVSRWLEANEECGVRIVPQYAPTFRGRPVPRLSREEDLVRAGETYASLTRTVAHIAHACEPWRTVLVSALNAGWAFVSWDAQHSQIFLDPAGRWARSAVHAERGLWDTLERLQPELQPGATIPRSASQEPHGAGTSGWPACPECGFAPLCGRYWTPAGDAALQSGEPQTAALAARLECAMRMTTLSALLDEWRREGRGKSYPGALRLSYVDKHLSYHTD